MGWYQNIDYTEQVESQFVILDGVAISLFSSIGSYFHVCYSPLVFSRFLPITLGL